LVRYEPPDLLSSERLPAQKPGGLYKTRDQLYAFVEAVRPRVFRDGTGISYSQTQSPPAFANASLLCQVAMHDFGRISLVMQRLAHRFREHHRAMPPARAAKRNRQIAFPFLDVMRDQINQQAFDSPQEFPGLRK